MENDRKRESTTYIDRYMALESLKYEGSFKMDNLWTVTTNQFLTGPPSSLIATLLHGDISIAYSMLDNCQITASRSFRLLKATSDYRSDCKYEEICYMPIYVVNDV